jgi:hypothetical protein
MGITGSGSLVSAWGDQSGNGRDLSLANPTNYLGSGTLNGLATIKSQNNANGYGAFLTSVNVPALTDATIFLVAKQTVADAALGSGVTRFIESNNNFKIMRHDPAQPNSVVFNATSSSSMTAIAITNSTFYSIRLKLGSGIMLAAVNNGSEVSGTSSGTPISNVLSMFGTGDKEIAEVLIYTRQLNISEITDIENYLKTKYAHY